MENKVGYQKSPTEREDDVDERRSTSPTTSDDYGNGLRLGGTGQDWRDMQRLGKKQQFKRNFSLWSALGFVAIYMATWEFVLVSLSVGFTNGGFAGLFWCFITTTAAYSTPVPAAFLNQPQPPPAVAPGAAPVPAGFDPANGLPMHHQHQQHQHQQQQQQHPQMAQPGMPPGFAPPPRGLPAYNAVPPPHGVPGGGPGQPFGRGNVPLPPPPSGLPARPPASQAGYTNPADFHPGSAPGNFRPPPGGPPPPPGFGNVPPPHGFPAQSGTPPAPPGFLPPPGFQPPGFPRSLPCHICRGYTNPADFHPGSAPGNFRPAPGGPPPPPGFGTVPPPHGFPAPSGTPPAPPGFLPPPGFQPPGFPRR
ncbi:hypothetical protein BN1723_008517 [Verticillium longisporum]|uniref:Uncharacterized protein n=1 Tax=Verticillium longisporum TaxID=100787 RepID=A0A0G4KG81_VERLO|nr:hypothetical protein BN1723_008517 [Verticillium longisporum]